MEKKSRFTGIDLLKGVAAFAVVVIHAKTGSVPSEPPGYWAEKIVQFSDNFAVPFFLATSFYLMIQKIYSNNTPYSFISRFRRLFVPYVFWSIVYLLFRASKHLINNDITKLNELFSDPLAIIFFGSASGQLYFIPLLLSGIFLVTVVMKPLLKKPIDIKLLGLLIIISIVANQIVLERLQISSLLIDVNKNVLLRLILVEVSWVVRCLPYIFVAMLLNHPFSKKFFLSFDIKHTIIFFSLSFILNIFDTFSILNISKAISEVCIAYFSLLFGISLSKFLKENDIIRNLGLCSFGIYFIHFLVFAIIQPIVYKIIPGYVSLFTLLISATSAYLISWIATLYLMKAKWISKFMFFA